MQFDHYVGVDGSKNKLDVAVYKGSECVLHQVIDNHREAIITCFKALKSLESFTLSHTVFCMEYTGIYNNPLLRCLHEKKGNVWLESATQIKNSLGNIRGKNDKIDAKRIGVYAYKNREDIKLWFPKREVIVQLERLTVLRDRLIAAKKQLSVPLKEQQGFVCKSLTRMEKKLCQRTLNSLEADLGKLDRQIEQLIKKD